jgi:hypothetical protein
VRVHRTTEPRSYAPASGRYNVICMLCRLLGFEKSSNLVTAVGVLFDECLVVGYADQGPRVTGKSDHGGPPEHRVDGPALETELTEIASR